MSPHELPEEPTFVREGRDIFLRCLNDDGEHMGDLRIARAEIEAHAATLVNAANAGMEIYRNRNVETGLRRLLDEGERR